MTRRSKSPHPCHLELAHCIYCVYLFFFLSLLTFFFKFTYFLSSFMPQGNVDIPVFFIIKTFQLPHSLTHFQPKYICSLVIIARLNLRLKSHISGGLCSVIAHLILLYAPVLSTFQVVFVNLSMSFGISKNPNLPLYGMKSTG